MADWKVSVERLRITPHPDPSVERLELAKVGMFQLVVGKGTYRDGDLAVFAPKRSVLPTALHDGYRNTTTGKSYLTGEGGDRVTEARLMGAVSEGVVLPTDWVLRTLGEEDLEDLAVGHDLSEALGITMYEPPLPEGYDGLLRVMPFVDYRKHDVESGDIYAGEFSPGEPVVATEKVHGEQVFGLIRDGVLHLSTKGLAGRGIEILEETGNLYWDAVRSSGVPEALAARFGPERDVQFFGEIVPVMGTKWSYGFTGGKPGVVLFGLIVDRREIGIAEVRRMPEIAALWAPVLYDGPYDETALRTLATGTECVSGRSLHRREGIVVSPAVPRNASEGFRLYVKFVDPKFKG